MTLPHDLQTGPELLTANDADETQETGSVPSRPVRAVGLVSGGLDSTLALRVIKELGVEVHAVNFYTGFCNAEVNRRVGGKHAQKEIAGNFALEAGAGAETEVEMIDISGEYIRMVLLPKHGYGKNVNPCIDCRIMMLEKARKIMEEEGADFVFTGEVLNQRPMSQHKRAMDLIERESGLVGRLLRPLSARHLKKTVVERKGLIDRGSLPDIVGRSRRKQMTMAEDFGVDEYPTPSGGCCQLTDENFARKFRDLAAQRLAEAGGDLNRVRITPEDTVLLGVGRHFRLGPATRLIVGRDEDENGLLDRYIGLWKERRDNAKLAGEFPTHFLRLTVRDFTGPASLLIGPPKAEHEPIAAGITARYSDGRSEAEVEVEIRSGGESSPPVRTLSASPAADTAIHPLRI